MLFSKLASLPAVQLNGSAILRRYAVPVELSQISSPATRQLVKDMWNMMEKKGGCGIAAPQIGVSQRVVTIDLPWQSDLPHVQAFPRTVLFNPELRVLPPAAAAAAHAAHAPAKRGAAAHVSQAPAEASGSGSGATYMMWESCLSVPEQWGRVERAHDVHVTYWDEGGARRHVHAWGYHAGMLQHELDHLHGRLYIDLARDLCSPADFERRFPTRLWVREYGGVRWLPAPPP